MKREWRRPSLAADGPPLFLPTKERLLLFLMKKELSQRHYIIAPLVRRPLICYR